MQTKVGIVLSYETDQSNQLPLLKVLSELWTHSFMNLWLTFSCMDPSGLAVTAAHASSLP